MADTSDKTHAPTPRRRELARREGQVAQSRELGSVVLLFGSVALLLLTGGALWEFMTELLRASLGGQAWQSWLGGDARAAATDQWAGLSAALGRLLLPILAGAAFVTAAVDWLQTGFLFRPERALPDLQRVNPANGWSRIFSAANWGRLAFGLGKVALVAAVAAFAFWSRREEIPALVGCDPAQLAQRAGGILLTAGLQVGAALAIVAVLDYGVVRWQLERRLAMTDQELREEMRELAGDPQVAARRRQLRHVQQSEGRSPASSSTNSKTAASARTAASVGSVESIP